MKNKITTSPPQFTINCQGKLLSFGTPKVMGILNTTPDSFYEQSRAKSISAACRKVEQMLEEGATFIDIGAMSSRPGSQIISSEKETQRLLPVLQEIRKQFPSALLSIDTIHANTARAAIQEGANLINDISGGNYDSNMRAIVSQAKCPFIAMHMRGTPATMQQYSTYSDVVSDVLRDCIQLKYEAEQATIKDIIIDPGFGFSKTIEQNYVLLKHLQEFALLHVPILVGVSRKSMIYKLLQTTPDRALNGSSALHMACLLKGASVLRVHDVKEAIECIALAKQIV